MRTFFVLLDRELRSFFNTPIAYVVIVFFLAVVGFQFHASVMFINNRPDLSVSLLEACFNFSFWFGFILCISLISMRSFADEFRMGTLETLTTAPVRDWQVVLAKFGGIFLFYVAMLTPTVLFFIGLQAFNDGPVGMGTLGAYRSTYLVLLMVGMLYVSVGCLASALVKDQINAAVITFAVIFITFFGALFLSSDTLVKSPEGRAVGQYFCPYYHLRDACAGRIDTQQLVFYPSITLLVLFLTLQAFQYRKWRA